MKLENQNITIGTVGKMTSAAIGIIAIIVSAVLAYASVRADTNQNKTAIVEIQTEQTRQDARVTDDEKNANEMNLKIDRAITILERIDKKVGRP